MKYTLHKTCVRNNNNNNNDIIHTLFCTHAESSSTIARTWRVGLWMFLADIRPDYPSDDDDADDEKKEGLISASSNICPIHEQNS